MKKPLFKTALLMISLPICVFCSACKKQSNSETGTFYTMREAYEKNYIDRGALLNIAFYYNKQQNLNDSSFVPNDISMSDINEQTIFSIKNTHLQRIKEKYRVQASATIEGVSIGRYFGKYNDCFAVIMTDKYLTFDLLPMNDIEIDGVTFVKCLERFPGGIEIWKKT